MHDFFIELTLVEFERLQCCLQLFYHTIDESQKNILEQRLTNLANKQEQLTFRCLKFWITQVINPVIEQLTAEQTSNEVLTFESIVSIGTMIVWANDFKLQLIQNMVNRLNEAIKDIDTYIPWQKIKTYYSSLANSDLSSNIKAYSDHIHKLHGQYRFDLQQAVGSKGLDFFRQLTPDQRLNVLLNLPKVCFQINIEMLKVQKCFLSDCFLQASKSMLRRSMVNEVLTYHLLPKETLKIFAERLTDLIDIQPNLRPFSIYRLLEQKYCCFIPAFKKKGVSKLLESMTMFKLVEEPEILALKQKVEAICAVNESDSSIASSPDCQHEIQSDDFDSSLHHRLPL